MIMISKWVLLLIAITNHNDFIKSCQKNAVKIFAFLVSYSIVIVKLILVQMNEILVQIYSNTLKLIV